MKKRLLIIAVLLLTVLPICFASACIGTGATSYELAGYDFSYDNVLEIGYISSIPSDGGTPYGNSVYRLQKGRSQEDDEIIKSVAEAWQNMQSNVTFKRQKKFNLLMACGGAGECVCVFKDGSRVRMHKDEVGNFKINNGKSCRLSEDDMQYYGALRNAYGTMIVPKNNALSISAAVCTAQLKSCDFSLSNVTKVIMFSSRPIETYSIRKGQSAEGDEALSRALEFWKNFQRQAVFNNDALYGSDHAIDGEDLKFKCVFEDGTYIQIGRDGYNNFVLNNFEPCQLDDNQVYADFLGIMDIMLKAKR